MLSLAPGFSYDMFTFDGFAFALNYGLNRVRFPAPMPVGGRVRMRAKRLAVEEIPGGAQITTELTFEREAATSGCAWPNRWGACTQPAEVRNHIRI